MSYTILAPTHRHFDNLASASVKHLADQMRRAGVDLADAVWYASRRALGITEATAADRIRIDRIAARLGGI